MSDKAWARLIAMVGIGLMPGLVVAPVVLGSYDARAGLFDTTAAALPMICATVGFGLMVLCRLRFERWRDGRSKKQSRSCGAKSWRSRMRAMANSD
jgi:hypothetical protein